MLELLHFRCSPYNEKVRWALDLKRVPHTRTPLLPGPHLPRMRKLTGSDSFTPLLVRDTADGGPLNGSAAILDWLEARYPTPALLPADEAEAARARDIQRRFDDDIGLRGRRAALAALLASPAYFAAVFGAGHGRLARAAYALTVPLAAPLVRKGNGIAGAAAIADGHAAFVEGLDYVAREAAATGYLVGRGFTVADRTAASMLAMCVDPPDSPMARPRPMPQSSTSFLERYATHPGADWVRGIYPRHRHARADFNGPSIRP
ncbi:MAG: glutathione S-transferase [Deltaproteobacteria bacterium]|nr:glutathione S-transferase [Deltaproteobacteria bacterium]